jgi:hypothetical protein
MKVLVVASEPVDEEVIDLVEDADEVRVIAPTLPGSALRYWLNDTDAALGKAQAVVDESAAGLADVAADVTIDAPTDDDPSVTIDDALRTFDPDRVVVLKHADDEEAYREDELVEEIQQSTDVEIDVRTLPAGDG